MSQADETFFTSVGCMDGRVQDVVADFGKQKFGVLFADTITEAGLVGLLAKSIIDQRLQDSLKFKIVDVSLGKHHAKGIVVHGHQECAGNPVDDETHKDDIRKSVSFVESLAGNKISVVGVFVRRSLSDSSQWFAEEISQTVTA